MSLYDLWWLVGLKNQSNQLYFYIYQSFKIQLNLLAILLAVWQFRLKSSNDKCSMSPVQCPVQLQRERERERISNSHNSSYNKHSSRSTVIPTTVAPLEKLNLNMFFFNFFLCGDRWVLSDINVRYSISASQWKLPVMSQLGLFQPTYCNSIA